jgi:predicted PurR-regulated permease PerM
METEWSETTRRMVAVACVLIGVLVLYISRSVIPFIILAAILAFLLNPIVVFCSSRLRMPRPLAVALAYLLLIVAIVLTPLVLVPAIIDAIRAIDIDLMGLLDESTMWLERSLEHIRHLQLLRYQLDLSPIVDQALEVLSGVVPEAMMPSLGQIVSSLPSAVEITTGFASTILSTVLIAILAFLFTLIYSIYISVDMPKMSRALLDLIPPPHRAEYAQLGTMVRQVWIAYLRGQVVLCLVIGTATGIGTAILGLPGALLLGILAGVLEVLPTIGPILASIPAIILALLLGSPALPVSNVVFALIVALFYWIVQQVENSVVVPRVIGSAIKVHPILVMAAVIVGASVGGIFGALVAAPTLATGRVLAQYVYNKLLGLPPFPPRPAPKPEDALAAQRIRQRASSLLSSVTSRVNWRRPGRARGKTAPQIPPDNPGPD